MSQHVRFSHEASAELAESAVRWYEEQRHGLGLAFLAAVEQAIESLARWPQAGAPVAGLGSGLPVRRKPVSRFPYHVAYLVTEDILHVLAIAHDRR